MNLGLLLVYCRHIRRHIRRDIGVTSNIPGICRGFLFAVYSHLKKYKSLKRNESHTALAALEALNEEKACAAWQQRPKGFKGNCNFCGNYGHKGVDCFKRKGNGATVEMRNQQQRLNRNLEVNAGFVECQVIGRVSAVVI